MIFDVTVLNPCSPSLPNESANSTGLCHNQMYASSKTLDYRGTYHSIFEFLQLSRGFLLSSDYGADVHRVQTDLARRRAHEFKHISKRCGEGGPHRERDEKATKRDMSVTFPDALAYRTSRQREEELMLHDPSGEVSVGPSSTRSGNKCDER